MEKRIIHTLRLLVPAKNAQVAPPLGPILGQFGVNIMSFCKQFNDNTKKLQKDILLPVIIFLYKDKSFKFYYKKPTISFLVNYVSKSYATQVKQLSCKDFNSSFASTHFNLFTRYTTVSIGNIYNIYPIKYNSQFLYPTSALKSLFLKYNKVNSLKSQRFKISYNTLLYSDNKPIKQKATIVSKKYMYIEHIYKICIFKFGLTLKPFEYFYCCKNIIGTLKSMHIQVI